MAALRGHAGACTPVVRLVDQANARVARPLTGQCRRVSITIELTTGLMGVFNMRRRLRMPPAMNYGTVSFPYGPAKCHPLDRRSCKPSRCNDAPHFARLRNGLDRRRHTEAGNHSRRDDHQHRLASSLPNPRVYPSHNKTLVLVSGFEPRNHGGRIGARCRIHALPHAESAATSRCKQERKR